MATHSSTLAWKISWTEELDAGYCPWGRKELGTTERLHFHIPAISKLQLAELFVHKCLDKLFLLLLLRQIALQ